MAELAEVGRRPLALVNRPLILHVRGGDSHRYAAAFPENDAGEVFGASKTVRCSAATPLRILADDDNQPVIVRGVGDVVGRPQDVQPGGVGLGIELIATKRREVHAVGGPARSR